MVFTRFVEVGRIVLLTNGADQGKLGVIMDVVDQTRALLHVPGKPRAPVNFKSLQLTPLTIKVARNQGAGSVQKVWEKENVEQQFAATSWGKKLATQKARAQSTDFERFKLALAKKKRADLIRKETAGLKSKAASQTQKKGAAQKKK